MNKRIRQAPFHQSPVGAFACHWPALGCPRVSVRELVKIQPHVLLPADLVEATNDTSFRDAPEVLDSVHMGVAARVLSCAAVYPLQFDSVRPAQSFNKTTGLFSLVSNRLQRSLRFAISGLRQTKVLTKAQRLAIIAVVMVPWPFPGCCPGSLLIHGIGNRGSETPARHH